MPSKTITVTSKVPNTITELSIAIAPRPGEQPKGFEADGFIHPDWGDRHDVELDQPITVTYGDDHNPYIDAVLVNYAPSNSKYPRLQTILGVGGVKGSEADNALNMYDTFIITLVPDNNLDVAAVMQCKNSNGLGGTVTFPKVTA